MNVIYNSDHYSVVEFGVDDAEDALRHGAYEIMDKTGKREVFLRGAWAEAFRESVRDLIAQQPSVEDIDDFLGEYDSLMVQRMTLH